MTWVSVKLCAACAAPVSLRGAAVADPLGFVPRSSNAASTSRTLDKGIFGAGRVGRGAAVLLRDCASTSAGGGSLGAVGAAATACLEGAGGGDGASTDALATGADSAIATGGGDADGAGALGGEMLATRSSNGVPFDCGAAVGGRDCIAGAVRERRRLPGASPAHAPG